MKILDCTLRDGGYYTKWDFKSDVVETYFKTMRELPVEYLEVGYRSTPQKEYFGKYFYLPDFVLKEVFKLAGGKKLAIMLNEKDIRPEHLNEVLNGLSPYSIRPGYGLHPKYYNDILGKTANKNIKKGTPLAWDLID
ncbi:MAG TPA: SAF domain-containing protein [Bacteroidales bacterium]|nr:SAF domain-containing protein [Bacteroidales bacterium]HQL70768.1 SAF domain-containing protein [Bacteroidales bacterium]